MPEDRFDCLLCEVRFLTEGELESHVESDHSQRDVCTTLLPINIPSVSRFQEDPEITTDREADIAINRDNRDGELPEVSEKVSNGNCPLCESEIGDDVTAKSRILSKGHADSHSVWEWYNVLREIVPREYEKSPDYDSMGYPDPAGAVNKLVPDDEVQFAASGWSQSVSSKKFQRETLTHDDTWKGAGVVTQVEDDPRDAHENSFRSETERIVHLVGVLALFDEEESVSFELTPKEDGSVRLKTRPKVTQPNVSKEWGRGSAGYVCSEVMELQRIPWHERTE